jgi:hypothetical protein
MARDEQEKLIERIFDYSNKSKDKDDKKKKGEK